MPSCADPSLAKGDAHDSTTGGAHPRDGRGTPLVVERCAPAAVSFAAVHARMLADQRARADGLLPHDRLVLFSPDPVVTLGSGAGAADLLLDRDDYAARGVEVHGVDRGGEATFHGPGQRVGYLTVRLGEDERDLHALLRAVEGALIDVLASYGIDGGRIDGKTGVWVEDRKIASIGLSVRRWVTGHGFALCVDGDLDAFGWIIPCGLRDCRYTTIERETGAPVDRARLDDRLAAQLAAHLGRRVATDDDHDTPEGTTP